MIGEVRILLDDDSDLIVTPCGEQEMIHLIFETKNSEGNPERLFTSAHVHPDDLVDAVNAVANSHGRRFSEADIRERDED